MRFEGFLHRPTTEDKFWGVEVPLLEIYSQGRSRKDALFMIKNAIEESIDKRGFKVDVLPGSDELRFTIKAKDPKVLVAFMLKRQRSSQGLTVREVAKRLHSHSPTAYARYEQGKVAPTIEKLIELLKAINPKREPVLTFA